MKRNIHLGLIISAIGILSTFPNSAEKKYTSYVVNSQLEKFDRISSDLKNLQSFVKEQKSHFITEKKILEDLKEKKEGLKSLVEVDKKIVDILFREQENRQNKSVWRERGFGFFIGLLSSLFASIIIHLVRRSK